MLTDVWLLFNVFVAADKYGVTKLMIECRRWINACLAILVGDEKAFSKLEKEGWMMKVGRALWQMDESRTFTVRTTYLWVVQAYLYRIMDLKWMKDLVAEVPEFSIELIRYLGKCCNDPQIAKEE